MPYEKQTFIDHETKLTAAHLQHIEDGIEGVFSDIDTLAQTAIQYTPQSLTEEQKAQARENIGVVNDIDVEKLVIDKVNEAQDAFSDYYPVEFEQGTVGSDGSEKLRSDRIKTVDYYPIADFKGAQITNSSYKFWIVFYDREKVFSSIYTPDTGYSAITHEQLATMGGAEDGYVRFIVFQVNNADLTAEEETGFGIYGNVLGTIGDVLQTTRENSILLRNMMQGESQNAEFEQGSIAAWGEEFDANNRIRTDYITTSTITGARVNTGYRIWYYTFDIAKNLIRADTGGSDYEGYQNITFKFASAERYVRIVVTNEFLEAPITPDANTGCVLYINSVNKKVDEAIKDAVKGIGGSRKGALGVPEYLLDVDGVYSDATWVGEKYVGISSTSSDDLEATAAAQMVVYDFGNGVNKSRANKTVFYHKWGHCNTIDYSSRNDCLIMGNGSGSYMLEGKIFIVPNFSTLIAGSSTIGTESNPFTLENTNAVVIDCTGYDLGTKFNVMWGEINGAKHNIAYLVTARMGASTSAVDAGDNGTIRRLLLGVGSTALEYGQYNGATASGAFNGTFEILDTYTQGGTAYPQCNQGSCFYRGSVYSAIGHDGVWLWKMHLGDGNIFYDEWKQYTYNDDGSIKSTNSSSCCLKDGYLYFGVANVGVMAFRLDGGY